MGGAAWNGLGAAGRIIIRMLSVAILARLVSPDAFGIAVASLIIVDFSIMLGNLGLSRAIVQRTDLSDRHVGVALSTAAAAGVVLAALAWVCAPLFAALLRVPEAELITRLMAIMILARMIGGIFEGLLARQMRSREIAIASLVSWSVGGYLVAIPLAYAGFGYWSIVFMSIAEAIVWTAFLGWSLRQSMPRPNLDLAALRELLPLSIGYAVMAPFVFLSQSVDRFLLARQLGVADLGFYSRATFLTTTAGSLFDGIIRNAAFPAMSQVQQSPERLRNAALHGTALTALLALPTGVFCAVFAPEMIAILLGNQWGPAEFPFAVFGLALYPVLGQRLQSAIFEALGEPYTAIWPQLVCIAGIIIAVILLAGVSLNAVVLGIAGAHFARYLVVCHLAWRRIDLHWRDVLPLHLSPLAVSLFVLGVGTLVRSALEGLPPALVLAAGVVVTASLLGGLCLYRPRLVLGYHGAELARRLLGSRGRHLRWDA